MATPNIFPEVHLKFIRHLYMRMMLQPAEVCDKLNLKYQTSYAPTQVQRVINNRGWSKRRKLMVEKLGEVEAVKDTAIVKQIADAHSKVMDDVAKGTEKGLTRALQFVERADNPRAMQAAASAVKTLMSSWMVASGVENSSNTRQTSNVFQINFASMPTRVPKPVSQSPSDPVLSLPVSAPAAPVDDADFDESEPL
jgi:hypothetical protein